MTEPKLYLTRLDLDTRKRSVRAAIADPRDLHRCLMKSFPDGLTGPARTAVGLLYRVERRGRTVLAQSCLQPHPDRLPDGFAARTVDITTMLERLRPHLVVRYECVAAPVKREARTKREYALKGDEAKAWWRSRASASGLDLLTDETGEEAATMEDHSLSVRGWRTIGYAAFSGLATVTDGGLVRSAVLSGIGRNKTWGAGLLTMAPMKDSHGVP